MASYIVDSRVPSVKIDSLCSLSISRINRKDGESSPKLSTLSLPPLNSSS